jgi:hypothetical protein
MNAADGASDVWICKPLQESDHVMKTMHLIPALSLLVPAMVSAQPQSIQGGSEFDHGVGPVQGALEISIGTGYSQGVGKVGGGMNDLQDLAGPGGSVELGLGYRIVPNLMIGAYGSVSTYQEGDALDPTTNVYGATAGIQAALHARPHRSVDPWVSLGTGWKGMWLDPRDGKTTSLQGLELARLQLGVDYRVSEDISISPMIGASLGMFVSQDSPMTTDRTTIESKEVNFTGFAGMAGRFDLGGKR